MPVLKVTHYCGPNDLTIVDSDDSIGDDIMVSCHCDYASWGHWGFIDRAALAALLEW